MADVESIPTKNYSEVIQINVPVRFYFVDGTFDGIEVGPFTEELMPWQQEMFDRVLSATKNGMGVEDE